MLRIEQIARQDHEIDMFGRRRFEYLLRRQKGRVDQDLVEVFGNLGQPVKGQFQVEIARL
jgi:hypothetical protein